MEKDFFYDWKVNNNLKIIDAKKDLDVFFSAQKKNKHLYYELKDKQLKYVNFKIWNKHCRTMVSAFDKYDDFDDTNFFLYIFFIFIPLVFAMVLYLPFFLFCRSLIKLTMKIGCLCFQGKNKRIWRFFLYFGCFNYEITNISVLDYAQKLDKLKDDEYKNLIGEIENTYKNYQMVSVTQKDGQIIYGLMHKNEQKSWTFFQANFNGNDWYELDITDKNFNEIKSNLVFKNINLKKWKVLENICLSLGIFN